VSSPDGKWQFRHSDLILTNLAGEPPHIRVDVLDALDRFATNPRNPVNVAVRQPRGRAAKKLGKHGRIVLLPHGWCMSCKLLKDAMPIVDARFIVVRGFVKDATKAGANGGKLDH
jgi:hypothetical protein